MLYTVKGDWRTEWHCYETRAEAERAAAGPGLEVVEHAHLRMVWYARVTYLGGPYPELQGDVLANGVTREAANAVRRAHKAKRPGDRVEVWYVVEPVAQASHDEAAS